MDHVTDIRQNWIKKLSALTVIKHSERSAPVTPNISPPAYPRQFNQTIIFTFFIRSHILCGWIAGHEAEHMESLPEEEFKQNVTELIHRFTGESQFVLLVSSAWTAVLSDTSLFEFENLIPVSALLMEAFHHNFEFRQNAET